MSNIARKPRGRKPRTSSGNGYQPSPAESIIATWAASTDHKRYLAREARAAYAANGNGAAADNLADLVDEQTPGAQPAPEPSPYHDIPAEKLEEWRLEWAKASATASGHVYAGRAFLDAFLRPPQARAGDPIPGILPAGEVMILTGRTGAGKTTLLLRLAVEKMLGHPIFDTWACDPGTVVYCATEDLHGVAERYVAALYHLKAEPEGATLYVLDRLPKLVEGSKDRRQEGGAEFFYHIRAEQHRGNLPRQIALLTVDYLANAKGEAQENSNDDIGLMMDALNRLARALSCGIIGAAHPGKNEADDRPRGAQVIADKAYCVAGLNGSLEPDGVREFKFQKNPKSAAKPAPLGFRLEVHPEAGVYLANAEIKPRTLRERVLAVLQDEKPRTGAQIAEELKLDEKGKRHLDNELTSLTNDPASGVTRGGKKPYLYTVQRVELND